MSNCVYFRHQYGSPFVQKHSSLEAALGSWAYDFDFGKAHGICVLGTDEQTIYVHDLRGPWEEDKPASLSPGDIACLAEKFDLHVAGWQVQEIALPLDD